MPDIFNSVFADETQPTLSVGLFLLCILVALVCGGIYLAAFSFRGRGSRSMRLSLTLLPAAVCVVIMMVNGNVGIGVAVAGASPDCLAAADFIAASNDEDGVAQGIYHILKEQEPFHDI